MSHIVLAAKIDFDTALAAVEHSPSLLDQPIQIEYAISMGASVRVLCSSPEDIRALLQEALDRKQKKSSKKQPDKSTSPGAVQ